jgi:hypothetical protein
VSKLGVTNRTLTALHASVSDPRIVPSVDALAVEGIEEPLVLRFRCLYWTTHHSLSS